jgi:branched-chain amino acid transport system substrate-binding protein
LLIAGCSLAPPRPAGGGHVEIAAMVPLSGPDRASGEAILAAVRYVVETVWNGRAEGISVSVQPFDTEPAGLRDPQAAALALQSALRDRLVLAAVGPLTSIEAAAQIPVAAGAGLALVSPAATNPCLTRPRSDGCPDDADLRAAAARHVFFRTVPADDAQANALAVYAARDLHAANLAVGSDGQPDRRALAGAFTGALKRAGGSAVVSKDFDPSQTVAVDSFLSDARDRSAVGVFMAGVGAGGACLPRARMGTAGLSASSPFLVTEPATTAECLKDAAGAAAGIYGARTGADATSPGSARERNAIANYRSRAADPAAFGRYSLSALDAAGVVMSGVQRAIKAAGGNQPARNDVRGQIAATRGFAASSGSLGFDSAGDPTPRVVSIYRSTNVDWSWVAELKV